MTSIPLTKPTSVHLNTNIGSDNDNDNDHENYDHVNDVNDNEGGAFQGEYDGPQTSYAFVGFPEPEALDLVEEGGVMRGILLEADEDGLIPLEMDEDGLIPLEVDEDGLIPLEEDLGTYFIWYGSFCNNGLQAMSSFLSRIVLRTTTADFATGRTTIKVCLRTLTACLVC
jgi:hypothetical protein